MVKSMFVFIFSLFISVFLFGQDKVYLKNGSHMEGKITYSDDTLVIIDAVYRNIRKNYHLSLYNVERISYDLKKKYSTIHLVGGLKLVAIVHNETDKEYVLSNVKKSKQDTLVIPKKNVLKISKDIDKTVFFDVGLLRGGGALIGVDLEIAVNNNLTFFVAGGYKGYGGGINLYFKEHYKGGGFKFGYNNQGFGETKVATALSGTFFYKMNPGLTVDAGLGYILNKYGWNNPYERYNVVLWYGLGYRF